MDTVRVDIAYRPLRTCWAIKQGDFATFREAVRTNHALWGGRFNPIVVVDRTSEAQALVEAYRADFVPESIAKSKISKNRCATVIIETAARVGALRRTIR